MECHLPIAGGEFSCHTLVLSRW